MPDGVPLTRRRVVRRCAFFNPRTRPVVPPIHQSVTYFLDDQSYKDVQAGGLDEIWYGRFRNPTVDVAAGEVGAPRGRRGRVHDVVGDGRDRDDAADAAVRR